MDLVVSFAPIGATWQTLSFIGRGMPCRPIPQDKGPGSPVCFPRTVNGRVMTGFCNCRANRKKNDCGHFSQLIKLIPEIKKRHGSRHAGEKFNQSIWFRLGTLLSEASPTPVSSVQGRQMPQESGFHYAFALQNNSTLARLLDETGALGVFAVNLAAKERAYAAPESMGMSSERSARIDKVMQGMGLGFPR